MEATWTDPVVIARHERRIEARLLSLDLRAASRRTMDHHHAGWSEVSPLRKRKVDFVWPLERRGVRPAQPPTLSRSAFRPVIYGRSGSFLSSLALQRLAGLSLRFRRHGSSGLLLRPPLEMNRDVRDHLNGHAVESRRPVAPLANSFHGGLGEDRVAHREPLENGWFPPW